MSKNVPLFKYSDACIRSVLTVDVGFALDELPLSREQPLTVATAVAVAVGRGIIVIIAAVLSTARNVESMPWRCCCEGD